jgi:hypothetical protein
MIGAKSMVVPYLPPKTLVGRNQKLNNYPRPGGHEGIQNLEGKKNGKNLHKLLWQTG